MERIIWPHSKPTVLCFLLATCQAENRPWQELVRLILEKTGMFVRTRLYAMPVVCAMCVMGGRDSWAQVESPQPGEGTTTPSNPPPQVRDIEVPRDRPRTLRVIPDTSPESGLQDEVRVPKEGLDLNLYLGGPESLRPASAYDDQPRLYGRKFSTRRHV